MSGSVDRRKGIGAYYTPPDVSRVLAGWAIRSASDRVLEPSFGKCGFLEAVVAELKHLGSSSPISQIWGFDIDPNAFVGPYEDLVRDNGGDKHFRQRDFLRTTQADIDGREFDVVIGNPPYVSHHNMSEAQRAAASRVVSNGPVALDGKASLWAYFVLHSLSFLRKGGRIAWVLPGSTLYADYSRSIIDLISDQFADAAAFLLGERLFQKEGATEKSVILLASGWQANQAARYLSVGYVATVDELEGRISEWRENQWMGSRYGSGVAWSIASAETQQAVDEVRSRCRTTCLGDLADIRIGMVTGDNRFFVIKRSTAERWGLEPTDWRYVLSKASVAPGLQVSWSDLTRADEADRACLLVHATTESSSALQEYFDEKDIVEIESNVTFGKREDWRCPDDGFRPDAFLTYMHSRGPRLILNRESINCTNALHRVSFRRSRSELDQMVVAVSLQSTFSRLSAEMEGRSYGDGVLKLEISEARNLELILPPSTDEPEIITAFKTVDSHVRAGRIAEAENAANAYVFGNLSQLKAEELCCRLRDGLAVARKVRGVRSRE